MGLLKRNPALSRFLANYGMLGVLALLCVYYSWATYDWQKPTGEPAAMAVAEMIGKDTPKGSRVLIVAGTGPEDAVFVGKCWELLEGRGFTNLASVQGTPAILRLRLDCEQEMARAMALLVGRAGKYGAIGTVEDCAPWVQRVGGRFAATAEAPVRLMPRQKGSNFLKPDNLLNVASQIAVIAVIAIGMTMVIITGGIDLSVGSLVALAAVLAGSFIRDWAGGKAATPTGMLLCCAGAVAVCAAVGAFSGFMIMLFRIPPFIATLAMMQVASGLAYKLCKGQSIYDIPDSFVWLGLGKSGLAIPNCVILMAGIYVLAHITMSRTTFGRYVYAIGGNAEAARLSGVHVGGVLLLVYTICGASAGVGGIIMASMLKSAAPQFGTGYELSVIAAVVVGGTSLAGGSGKILSTLIGAFIIGVVTNGMNLTNVEPYDQKVVLGLVLLGAVLLDILRKGDLRRLLARFATRPRVGAEQRKDGAEVGAGQSQ